MNSSVSNLQYLSTQHSVPLYTTLNFCQYNTQFLSIQHSTSVNKSLNSSLYNTQFLSIQHWIPLFTTLNTTQHSVPLYTTLNFCQYNTQFLSIQHSTLVIFTNLTRRFLRYILSFIVQTLQVINFKFSEIPQFFPFFFIVYHKLH